MLLPHVVTMSESNTRVTMIVSHVHIIVKYQNCYFTSSYLYVFTFVWYDTESAGPCSSS